MSADLPSPFRIPPELKQRVIDALIKKSDKIKSAFLQLEIQKDGDFYCVNSAFPVSANYLTRKEKKEGWKPLRSRYPVPADASGASSFAGQSPNAGEVIPMVSSQSGLESLSPEVSEVKERDVGVATDSKTSSYSLPHAARNYSPTQRIQAVKSVQAVADAIKAAWGNSPDVIVGFEPQTAEISVNLVLADSGAVVTWV